MALNQFSRTQLLLGQESMDLLAMQPLPFSVSAAWAAIPWRHWQEAVSAILCW